MNMPDTVHLPNDYRVVDAGRGAGWVSGAFTLFFQQPGMWILLWLAFVLIHLMVAFIPMGGLLATLFNPVFIGGFMIAAAFRAKGEDLDIAHLFAGFRKTGPLVIVGAIMLGFQFVLGMVLTTVVVIGLMGTGVGAAFMDFFVNADGPNAAASSQALTEALQQVDIGLLAGLGFFCVFMLLLYALVAFGISFAPALVALGGMQPWPAIKLSFRAVMSNWLPFTVYGLVAVVLAVVAMLPLFLGFLIVSPVFIITGYVAYKDVFPELADELPSD